MKYIDTKRIFTKKASLLLTFMISALLACACSPHADAEKSSPTLSDSSDDYEQSNGGLQSYFHDQFMEKYATDFNFLFYEIDDSFYEILLNNPIDQWRNKQANTESFSEMLDVEERVYSNWIRECDSSIAFLCEQYPNLSQKIHEEQAAWKTYIDLLTKNAEMMIYHLDVDGALQWVNIAVKKTDLARERAFNLMYLEYMTIHTINLFDEKQNSYSFEIEFY